jgi:putative hemolysin
MRITRNFIAVAALLMLCGTLFIASAQTAGTGTTTSASTPATTAPPEAYCTSTGGQLEARIPVYNTNGPIGSWLPLEGSRSFCQYTSSSDGSRIHVSIETLFTTKPTLAALAYYAEVPYGGGGGGSPASYYCTQLGGTDLFGGVNAAGGGWVMLHTTDEVLDACIFPDMSTIDSWGLFYHSAGIVRGTDLSTVLKYPNPYPASKKSK